MGHHPEVEVKDCIGDPSTGGKCGFKPSVIVTGLKPKWELGIPGDVGSDPIALVIVSVCSLHVAAVRSFLSDLEPAEVLPVELAGEVEASAREDFGANVWRLVPAAA